jgi:hypothetical protein
MSYLNRTHVTVSNPPPRLGAFATSSAMPGSDVCVGGARITRSMSPSAMADGARVVLGLNGA